TIGTPLARAASSTGAMVRTTASAPEMSRPARSSRPPRLAKAFCMSTTTTADCSSATASGSGRVRRVIMANSNTGAGTGDNSRVADRRSLEQQQQRQHHHEAPGNELEHVEHRDELGLRAELSAENRSREGARGCNAQTVRVARERGVVERD